MKTSFKFIAIFVVLILITFSVLQIRYLNIASAGETCPHTGDWTKIDNGDLSLYPVNNAVEYCFKAGNYSPVSQIPSGGFGQSGSCNSGIQYCDLSHWSYRISTDQPIPTPTEVTQPTPTDDPSPTPTDVPEATPTPTDEATPTPTNEPEITPELTPEDEVDPTPTPTDNPDLTPTPTIDPIETQIGGIGGDDDREDGDDNSDENSDDSDNTKNSSTQAILATNTFSDSSEVSVLAATGGYLNMLMNSMALSGFATFLLGIGYHVKKDQEK